MIACFIKSDTYFQSIKLKDNFEISEHYIVLIKYYILLFTLHYTIVYTLYFDLIYFV